MMNEEVDDEEWFNVRGPSKSSRKRESSQLQDLGELLMALSKEQLERLDLPEALFEAVRVGQGITAHGGLQRQRKYIGKLIRSLDPEPIREGLQALKGETSDLIRVQHQAERWRDRMIGEGDEAINAFVSAYGDTERQKLRQWVRDALRERDRMAPPRAARLLFKYLRDVLSNEEAIEDISADEAEGS